MAFEILSCVEHRSSAPDYTILKADLDRLQSTTVATSIRQVTGRRLHRFSWVNEWKERSDSHGRAQGLELILPDWFYSGLLERTLILTIDQKYFSLTGGIERWLYRVVRKHAGRQPRGWRFDFRHLYAKSGSLARFSDFALDVRRIARRQSLPGYWLNVERRGNGAEWLAFRAGRDPDALARAVRELVELRRVGDKL
jgi:plasmid replication initiation protein